MPLFASGHHKRVAAVILLVFMVCCAAPGQMAQAPQTPPGTTPTQSEAGTTQGRPATPAPHVADREVQIDVVVADRAGRPVTGLKASDFTVTEEYEPQVIRSVEEHYPISAADLDKIDAGAVLPPNTFSNYTAVPNTGAFTVLLLDARDTSAGPQSVLRGQLIDYLKHLQPGPPIAIFQLDAWIRMIQGFTTDPKALLAAVESQLGTPALARLTANRRVQSGAAQRFSTPRAPEGGGMLMLDKYLAGFPGRINLILFTERVPEFMLGYGVRSPFHDRLSVKGGTGAESSKLTDVITVSRVAIYPVDMHQLPGMSQSIYTAETEGTPREIGPVPGPDTQPALHVNNNGFEMVAEQTGGKVYFKTDSPASVIPDVINNGSNYYTITYDTANTVWHGALRPIAVTVDRPDVSVQHRLGYYAFSLDKPEQGAIVRIEKRGEDEATHPKGSAAPSGSQPPVGSGGASLPAGGSESGGMARPPLVEEFAAAMAPGAIPPTEIIFRVHIQPEMSVERLGKQSSMPTDNFLKPEWQHRPFRNYTIFYDADVREIRFTQTPDGMRHGEVEFVAIAYTAKGEQVNMTGNATTLNVTPGQYRELLASGLHSKAQIAVPMKGRFFLRLGVHDETDNQVGALEIPVDEINLDVLAASPQKP